MKRRVEELQMSWIAVSRSAGMSSEGLRAIRRGKRQPQPVTKARLERVLGWQPGSIDAVLAGGDPAVAPPADELVTTDELKQTRRILIDALRLDDADQMREALADALGVVARALNRQHQDETG